MLTQRYCSHFTTTWNMRVKMTGGEQSWEANTNQVPMRLFSSEFNHAWILVFFELSSYMENKFLLVCLRQFGLVSGNQKNPNWLTCTSHLIFCFLNSADFFSYYAVIYWKTKCVNKWKSTFHYSPQWGGLYFSWYKE